MLASIDGAIGPAEEARIPVSDEGLLRGDGAFEVMRLYQGRPFAFEDHLARLGRTCAGLRLELDLDVWRAEIAALLEANGPAEALLRLVLTRGGRRIALIEPAPRHKALARVATITYAPNRVLDGLKTLSYAGNMLATRLAKEGGFDEALLVTPHGRILEGPTWSFFWVRDGRLYTPPLERADPRLDHPRAHPRGDRRDRGDVHARRAARRRGGVHRVHDARRCSRSPRSTTSCYRPPRARSRSARARRWTRRSSASSASSPSGAYGVRRRTGNRGTRRREERLGPGLATIP